jgi:hypothetical protein
MPRKPAEVDIRPALAAAAARLTDGQRCRAGHVIFRLGAAGDVHLRAAEDGVSVVDGVPARADGPRAEVIGDVKLIRAILEKKKAARAHFLAGGFRIRGDLRYLSEIGMALGILDRPI